MSIFGFILYVVSAYGTFWALYVVALPALASVRNRKIEETGNTAMGAEIGYPEIVVIVPAHNMERYITRCVDSLRVCRYPKGRVELYVVADHCTDETLDLALDAGATVLVRDVEPRGKTYTIAWALEELRSRRVDPDLYVIVDATAKVDSGFLQALASRHLQGAEIVISHPVLDLENQQWFARCLGLTLTHRNVQSLARERLGLSVFISGRGMAYGRAYIQQFGWRLALPSMPDAGSHPTEDWRHGVQIVEHGHRAAFADDARVYTPLRESLGAATRQGLRWERGRMANASTHGLRLLAKGLRQGSLITITAALDAIQPPVAILAALCAGVAFAAVTFFENTAVVVLGCLPAVLIGLYGLAVVSQGRREGIKPVTILWAPVYVAWRCVSFVGALGQLDRLRLPGRK